MHDFTLNSTIIGFIGALIGGLLSFLGTYIVYKGQIKDEQKSVAKAIEIDLKYIYNYFVFRNYYEKHKNENLENDIPSLDEIDLPTGKLYDNKTLLYFAFKESITKLDPESSSKIFFFYKDLFRTEEDRIFVMMNISNHKEKSFTNANPELKEGVLKGAKNMKFLIVNCGKRISEICKELEEIYDLVTVTK